MVRCEGRMGHRQEKKKEQGEKGEGTMSNRYCLSKGEGQQNKPEEKQSDETQEPSKKKKEKIRGNVTKHPKRPEAKKELLDLGKG